jgi:cobalt/nickel transport protein
MWIRLVLLSVALLGPAPEAFAHYNMLLPEMASVKRGEALTIIYQWGHPFEHQLFDAPFPTRLLVISPEGQRTELTDRLEKATRQAGDKKVTVYQLRFTPERRGDYVFFLETPPIWMEEDQEFLQDTVKVVLHVQAQKGWDSLVTDTFEIEPLTRPYGLEPGMVFQARALVHDPPGRSEGARRPTFRVAGAGSLVEVERYNRAPPKELPPDEHITRTMRTDVNAVATCTLPDPGWWCITAQRQGGQHLHGNKLYPVRQRATFWVHVDEKVVQPSAK